MGSAGSRSRSNTRNVTALTSGADNRLATATKEMNTPETDKAERMAYAGEYMVPTEVARKLERERAEAQEDLAELCKRYNELVGVKEPRWYNGREIPADIKEGAK